MKKGTVDLSSIDTVKGANEGFDVRIYHPGTNEDLDITINVLGKDSDEFVETGRKQSKKRMAKMSKGGFRNTSTVPIEEIEQDGIELLAACTKSWAGVVIEGKQVAFSHGAAVDLYTRFPWIKEQVDTAIGDRANFIVGSSKPSSSSQNASLA